MVLGIVFGLSLNFAQKSEVVAFKFNEVEYVHRYRSGNLNEYTPKKQPDLKTWVNMITINDYPTAMTGEDLAKVANAVLESYQNHNAKIIRTNSIPKSDNQEAEHFIAAYFPTKDYVEVSFARFAFIKKRGLSIVFSHRIYEKKAGDATSQYLKTNGEKIEKQLMKFSAFPGR